MPEYTLSTEAPNANQGTSHPAPGGTTIQDNMARITMLLDQLTKAVIDVRERTARTESQLSEIRPCLDAMKIHVDSFPNALREARRSNVALQQQVEKLSLRVAEFESPLTNGPAKA